MNRQDILATLLSTEGALCGLGVTHAALFGSRARDHHHADSDIDIMVEFDPEARVTVFDYVRVKDLVAGLFQGSVDVVDRDGLKPSVLLRLDADALYAF